MGPSPTASRRYVRRLRFREGSLYPAPPRLPPRELIHAPPVIIWPAAGCQVKQDIGGCIYASTFGVRGSREVEATRARSVAVSYNPPMCVARVRVLACALEASRATARGRVRAQLELRKGDGMGGSAAARRDNGSGECTQGASMQTRGLLGVAKAAMGERAWPLIRIQACSAERCE